MLSLVYYIRMLAGWFVEENGKGQACCMRNDDGGKRRGRRLGCATEDEACWLRNDAARCQGP